MLSCLVLGILAKTEASVVVIPLHPITVIVLPRTQGSTVTRRELTVVVLSLVPMGGRVTILGNPSSALVRKDITEGHAE